MGYPNRAGVPRDGRSCKDVTGSARPTIVRLTLAAAALLVAAWFALGLRQAIATDRASAIVQSSATLTPARARRAEQLLREASFLNPDSEVQLLRSQVAMATGDRATARRLAAQVTRREPLNAAAWYQLVRATGPTAARALQRLAALVRTVPAKP
jgi:predicted Zn-dependent protease